MEGKKYDTEKNRWDLLPMEVIEKAVEVLTIGAKKYNDWNWVFLESGKDRYYSALMRHLVAWRNGNKLDDESGKEHLSHALCCLIFLSYLDNSPDAK